MLLFGCFNLQKLYGREPEAFKLILPFFHELLADYDGERVIQSLKLWLKTSREFPTPADIIQEIEHPKQKISAGTV